MNPQNVEPYTFDKLTATEQRQLARQGGIASGKARKRKANFKRAANLLLSLNPSEGSVKVLQDIGIDDEEINNALAIVYALNRKAQKGDVNAARLLYEWTGQNAEDKRRDEELKIRKAELEMKMEQIALEKGKTSDEPVKVVIDV